MSEMAGTSFGAPPVVETVIGVEFPPLAGWGIPHIGLYWAEIREAFPSFEIQPALSSQIERFGADAKRRARFVLELGDPSRPRCWFVNSESTRLLQLQDTRFILNWRKAVATAEYPRFDTLLDQFLEEWARFAAFLKRTGLPMPQPMPYVDHLPQGDGWKTYADLPSVLPAWAGLPDGDWQRPEAVAFNARYVLPENRGRLHIAAQPAIRNEDGREVVQLSFTARGAPNEAGPESLKEWFDFAHGFAFRAFLAFTSGEMHRRWKRRDSDGSR
jgi:uncharacterized protein (TIGR04255 family)